MKHCGHAPHWPKEVYARTLARLGMLGISPSLTCGKAACGSILCSQMDASTAAFLRMCVEKAGQRLLDACNLSRLPPEIWNVAADMACGEYLNMRRSMGYVQSGEAAVTSIKEGDTQVSYAAERTEGQRLDDLIAKLQEIPREVVARYRRLRW